MDHSLFISDLHLCESRSEIINAFHRFLSETASKAHALYILGDLFEYWAGDDAIVLGTHAKTITALKQLSAHGVGTYLIRGNRDFLLDEGFAKAANITILPDPSLVTLHHKTLLLCHGDTLCTDDIAYQRFRTEVRSTEWIKSFLKQPLAERVNYIESIRQQSEAQKSIKSMAIMDVNQSTVAQLFTQYNYPTLIHGHTHRPNQHQHTVDGHQCERWVLGDWYDQGSYLRLDNHGFHVHTI